MIIQFIQELETLLAKYDAELEATPQDNIKLTIADKTFNFGPLLNKDTL